MGAELRVGPQHASPLRSRNHFFFYHRKTSQAAAGMQIECRPVFTQYLFYFKYLSKLPWRNVTYKIGPEVHTAPIWDLKAGSIKCTNYLKEKIIIQPRKPISCVNTSLMFDSAYTLYVPGKFHLYSKQSNHIKIINICFNFPKCYFPRAENVLFHMLFPLS